VAAIGHRGGQNAAKTLVALNCGATTVNVAANTRQRQRGWTLIELSIVLFVITLLSAFAIPSYREQVARGHRLAVVDTLQALALMAESAAADDVTKRSVGRYSKLADRFVPPHGAPVYRVTMLPGAHRIGGVALQGYVLQAAPLPERPRANDACGTFVMDATGMQLNRHPGGQWLSNAESCWRSGRAPWR